MCSGGRALCSGSRRSHTSDSSSKGSQYAVCALGMGLVALGVVMIVWTIVPSDATQQRNATSTLLFPFRGDETKTSSVAFVLVGAGIVMLLLASCLAIRNKRRMRRRETAGRPNAVSRVSGEHADVSDEEPAPSYDVPTYEEAVSSGQYPVRQSNLRQSCQLPSYEDLVAAVEGQGGPGPQPGRSSSRAGRLFRPLKVRRIKSEKVHSRDLNVGGPEHGGAVPIEPLTPPPQYEDTPPRLSTE